MKNLLKKVLILLFIIYFVYTIISQQKTLNAYAQEKAERITINIDVAEEDTS